MATYYELNYTSRLARHRYILWTDNQYSGRQVSIPDRKGSRILNIPVSSFNQHLAPFRYGRFYPGQILKISAKPPAGFFRVRGIDRMEFTADFNHPLAGKDVTVKQRSLQCESPGVGKPHMLLEWAGIDSPLNEQNTDFSIPRAFDRQDPSDDSIFYKNPRNVIHIDKTCISRITSLYEQLLMPHAVVLDLMSSCRSHLPEFLGSVAGLGMNREEMEENPQLESYVVHDLNQDPTLPFDDQLFDAVVNTVSVEYLIHPLKVLEEVRRILKPGGIFIITFSNRYFPSKTSALWIQLHPVERLGWVLQMVDQIGFSELHGLVEQGLKRSSDDRYSGQIEGMDPLFAAWGKKEH